MLLDVPPVITFIPRARDQAIVGTLEVARQNWGWGLVMGRGSVVVSGSLPAKDGSHSLYCAVIVKQVDAKTRAKTSVNELLRGAVE